MGIHCCNRRGFGVWMLGLSLLGLLAAPAALPGAKPQAGVPWLVKPDPAQGADAVKPDLSLTEAVKAGRSWVVPNRPSSFVLTYAPLGSSGWEVWDLRAGAKARGVAGALALERPMVSPDGEYLAGTRVDRPGQAGTLLIWSLKTAGFVAAIKPLPRYVSPEILGFAAGGRAVVHHKPDFAGERFVRVYDLPGGNQRAEFPVPTLRGDNFWLSPGGAYAAVLDVDHDTLKWYATDTGSHAGSIRLDTLTVKSSFVGPLYFTALDFSPDGRELALLYSTDRLGRIATYSLETGKKVADFGFEDSGRHQLKTLGYVPDNSGWLAWGDTLISRAAGSAVYTFPRTADDVMLARMISPQRLLRGVRSHRQLRFETVDAPKDILARVTATVQAGGTAEDAKLPPLTRPETRPATATIAMASAPATPWLVRPDTVAAGPAPGPPGATAGATRPLAPSIPIRPAPKPDPAAPKPSFPRQDEPTGLVFTSRAAYSVVVEHADTDHSPQGGPFRRLATWVECYDLATGTVQGRVETSGLMQLQDASPSGKTLVFRSGSGRDRIDVMTLDSAGAYKPLAAFRPYPADPSTASTPRSAQDDTRTVESAQLIDDTHVLTLSAAGVLVLWEFPACRAVWRAETGDGGVPSGRRVALSPLRKLGAVGVKGSLVIFDTATGKPINAVPIAAQAGAAQAGPAPRVGAAAMSPDGRQLAAVVSGANVRRLFVFDLTTGATTADLVVPPEPQSRTAFDTNQAPPIQFASPGYVLVGTYLINLARKGPVWRYETPELGFGTVVRYGPVAAYDGGWFLAPPGGMEKSGSVVHALLPHEDARKAEAELTPENMYDWRPGMTVSLQVSVVGDEEYRRQEVARWTEQLRAMGFTVADGSPNVLTANTFVLSGEPVEFLLMNANGTVKATPRGLGWDIRLSIGGTERWRTENNSPPTFPKYDVMRLPVKPGESSQQAADRMSAPPARGSQIVLPPAYFFKQRDLPVTVIGTGGIR